MSACTRRTPTHRCSAQQTSCPPSGASPSSQLASPSRLYPRRKPHLGTAVCRRLMACRRGCSGLTGCSATASVDKSSLNSGSGVSLTTSSVLKLRARRPPVLAARTRRMNSLEIVGGGESRWKSGQKVALNTTGGIADAIEIS